MKELTDYIAWLNTQPRPSVPLPPITGEMTVPSSMTARDLGYALRRKPFQIVADLIAVGVFCSHRSAG